jgi:hypothetical protein
MYAVLNNLDGSRENWLEIYSAIYAVKQILERSPTVYLQEINREEGNQAEQLGKDIGKAIADAADQISKNFRN